MSNQLLNHGDTLDHNGNVFEVTGISSQDGTDGEQVNFSYQVRLQSDVEADRQAEREAAEAAKTNETEVPTVDQLNQNNPPTEG